MCKNDKKYTSSITLESTDLREAYKKKREPGQEYTPVVNLFFTRRVIVYVLQLERKCVLPTNRTRGTSGIRHSFHFLYLFAPRSLVHAAVRARAR